MMESSNPVLNEKTIRNFRDQVNDESGAMTVTGTINKTGILVLITMLTSAYSWTNAEAGGGLGFVGIGIVVTLILSLVIVFKKEWSPFLAPAYAACEGLIVGAISFYFNVRYPGIVFNAMVLTFGTLFGMVVLYHTGVLRATEQFKKIMFLAMIGIMCTYLVNLLMSVFASPMPFMHEGSPFGIIFSLVVVGVAALNFILDFDMIERSAQARMPKYMEWYGGFAVLVTVIWLYFEILRLLSKLNSRK
jgi:uncharacterized YccA/Bax inhibitor family protein